MNDRSPATSVFVPAAPAVPATTLSRGLGFVAMMISGISFGGLAILVRIAYASGASPTTVLFFRFTIAAVVMSGLMVARGLPWPQGRTLLALIGMGGIAYVGQSLTFFMALTMASASLVALLLYLYPIIVTLFSAVFFKEQITRFKLGAVILALVGTALTIGPVGGGRPLGIFLGVSASLIYAVYILIGSKITPRAGAIPSSTIIIGAAAVVYGALMLIQGPALPQTTAGWLAVVGMAVISTVLAIVTFFIGLELIGPTAAATLSALEPLVAVILAVVILDEQLVALQIVGGALIVVAVVALARQREADPTAGA